MDAWWNASERLAVMLIRPVNSGEGGEEGIINVELSVLVKVRRYHASCLLLYIGSIPALTSMGI